MADEASFSTLGVAATAGPVVIAVPHAGRHYPPALVAAARLPRAALETIEDRHADLLIADAVAAGAIAIVARFARAYLDLNRDPREVDAAMMRPDADAPGWLRTEKVAGGLGVVPSRIAAGGAVWKRPFDAREVAARIERVHAPYHAALAAALAAAHARHGVAVLVDLHSMPPLGRGRARVVIGDRHGASCAPAVVAAMAGAVERAGLRADRNRPYAGGYTLERHGRPRAGVHAVQVEIDRALYLDPLLLSPGAGLTRTRTLVAALVDAAAGSTGLAIAAE